MEGVECGAAALGIILGYFGRFVPLTKLREETGVSRDGSNALNIVKVAESYGLEAHGYKKEVEELYDLDFPVIVFWGFGHFLVVEGFDKKKVYLNDPAIGPRTVTYEEFSKDYTGVVLTFKPTSTFQKGGKKSSLYDGLKERVQDSKIALAFIVLVGLALVLPGLVLPIFTKIFIDDYLVNQFTSWIKPLLIGMLATALIRGMLTYIQQFHLLKLETKIALSTSSKFFWHVFKLPMEFFTQRSTGDLSSRIQLNNNIANLLSGQLATSILSCVTIVFYVVVMFFYDVRLTVVGIVIAALNIIALQYISRKRKDLNKRMVREQYLLIGTSMQGIGAIETIKATGSESDFFSKWSGYLAKLINAQQRLGVYTQVLTAVPPFLSALNTAIILWLGSLQVMDGNMTMGMLVAFQSLMVSFITPVNSLVNLGSNLQLIEADIDKVDDVTQNEIDKTAFPEKNQSNINSIKTFPKVKLDGYLEMNKVTFGYNPLSPPLLSEFSLSLKPGSRVALVGASGSGKSTIAKLISGLYHPWSGEILFDSMKREDIPREVMVNSFAMVNQDIFMFSGTIRENLTMWNNTIKDGSIFSAAKDADIHDIILSRPNGYESEITEGGDNFSGGQKQRLEIARALCQNPAILVMDEATSSLDPMTEKYIDDNVRRRGCTCLIIAHRLSTIRDSDEIIVLDDGKVVQRGTHDSLIKEGGLYSKLIKMEQ